VNSPEDLPNAISDPDLRGQAEAENKNFEFTTRTLGDTAELVQDFQDLYKTLAGSVLIPDGGAVTERAKVAIISLHLLMKSRANLLIGCLTLLRGYQGNSLLFLRGAIEACAIAALLKAKPGRADLWLNAGGSEEAYRQYRKKFRELFPKGDALLQELYGRYDWCSRVIHGSPYSLAGHCSYPDSETEDILHFKLFDLPGDHTIVSSLYFTLDAHKRVLTKFADVLADNIRANERVWQLHFNSLYIRA
jgi:hypothetical protein